MQLAIKMVKTAYLSGTRLEAYENLQSILNLLGKNGFTPDIFSFSDEPGDRLYRVPFPNPLYNDHFLETKGSLFLHFLREEKPKYEFYPGFISTRTGYNSLSLEIKDVDSGQVAAWFEMASFMAQVTCPLFGGLGFFWEAETPEAEKFNNMLNTGSLDLFKNGPDSVALRTWFGPAFAAQLDPLALEKLGLVVRQTAWNGLEVDLVEAPWAAPFERLAEQKAAFNGYLNRLGLLGDYSRTLLRTPGRNWGAVQVLAQGG